MESLEDEPFDFFSSDQYDDYLDLPDLPPVDVPIDETQPENLKEQALPSQISEDQIIDIPIHSQQNRPFETIQMNLNHLPQMQPNLVQMPNNRINFRTALRRPPRHVDLNCKATELKERFYRVFITKKRFNKQLVKKIHDKFIMRYLISDYGCDPQKIKKVQRDQERQFNTYFNYYSEYTDQIIQILKDHKDDIVNEILIGSIKSGILK